MLPNVHGIILDSPPYKITPEQFVTGFAGSVEVPALLRPANNLVWRAFFSVYLSEQRLQRFKEMEHELIHHPVRVCVCVSLTVRLQPRIPQLVFYSDADTITPAEGLPEYLAIQRARGLDVRAVNFHTSPHVQHMRHYPDQYWSEVAAFIDDCAEQRFGALWR